jgi:integrase
MARIKSKKYNGVYLNHLANKDVSYSIVYKDEYGKTVRFTVGKKSEGITEVYAYNKRNEFVNKVRLGEDPLAHKKKKKIITLDQVANDHYEAKELHNRNNRQARANYKNHIQPVLGHRAIDSITRKDVEKFQQLISKKVSRSKKVLSKKTVNLILGELGVILSYAVDYEIIVSNPVHKVRRLKVDNARERFLDTDEIKLLLNEVKDIPKLYIFILIALTTGARSGAIHLLRKKDIDLHNQIITLKDEKSQSTYKAFLENKELISIFQKLLPKLKSDDVIMEYLFNSKHSKNLTERQLRPIFHELFNKELDKNDLKNRVVIHTLRHTFASNLAMNGTPIYTIQKLMNHKDINMTLRYAKLAPESGRDAVRQLYMC